jgi:hypothetical protein
VENAQSRLAAIAAVPSSSYLAKLRTVGRPRSASRPSYPTLVASCVQNVPHCTALARSLRSPLALRTVTSMASPRPRVLSKRSSAVDALVGAEQGHVKSSLVQPVQSIAHAPGIGVFERSFHPHCACLEVEQDRAASLGRSARRHRQRFLPRAARGKKKLRDDAAVRTTVGRVVASLLPRSRTAFVRRRGEKRGDLLLEVEVTRQDPAQNTRFLFVGIVRVLLLREPLVMPRFRRAFEIQTFFHEFV